MFKYLHICSPSEEMIGDAGMITSETELLYTNPYNSLKVIFTSLIWVAAPHDHSGQISANYMANT